MNQIEYKKGWAIFNEGESKAILADWETSYTLPNTYLTEIPRAVDVFSEKSEAIKILNLHLERHPECKLHLKKVTKEVIVNIF